MKRMIVRWRRMSWPRFLRNALFASLAGIGIVQIIVWLDYRDPVTVTARVFESTTVQAGGELRYTNHFVRTKFCHTFVDRWFVGSDGVIRNIDPLPSAMPTEGLNQPQSAVAKIVVPYDMPPGPAKSCFRSRWQCNPIQGVWPINGPVTCLPFDVEEDKG